MHADPPVEHKAYLHRSGRTARAGASGTVVTLMLDAQVSDVRDLTRKAGIKPTITRVAVGHAVLQDIAPGERTFVAPEDRPVLVAAGSGRRRWSRRSVAARGGSGGGGRGGAGGGGRRSGGGRRGGGTEATSGSSAKGGSSQGRGGSTRGRSGPASSGRPHSAASFSSSSRGR